MVILIIVITVCDLSLMGISRKKEWRLILRFSYNYRLKKLLKLRCCLWLLALSKSVEYFVE